MKQLFWSAMIAGLCIWTSSIFAFEYTKHSDEIYKLWEIPLEDIYPNDAVYSGYSPLFIGQELIMGSRKGYIKSIHVDTMYIKDISKISMNIEKSLTIQKLKDTNYAVLFGKHLESQRPFYCSVDIDHKEVKGYVNHSKDFISLGEFAIFEMNHNFIVFNPSVGKGVYTQKEPKYNIMRALYTQDEKRHLFQSTNKEVVEITLPKFGASLIMSPRSKKKDVLDMKVLIALDDSIYADNLTGNSLYYHKKEGFVGLMDIKTKKMVWEKRVFEEGMEIQGPHILGDKIYYLLSYPKEGDNNLKNGRLVCIDRKSGKFVWEYENLEFQNFGVVNFDRYILAANNAGELVFLNVNDGSVMSAFYVGKGICKPVINNEDLYIMTDDRIYRFFSNRVIFKARLLWDRFIDSIF